MASVRKLSMGLIVLCCVRLLVMSIRGRLPSLAVVTKLSNESALLPEWLEYYRAQGASRVLVFTEVYPGSNEDLKRDAAAVMLLSLLYKDNGIPQYLEVLPSQALAFPESFYGHVAAELHESSRDHHRLSQPWALRWAIDKYKQTFDVLLHVDVDEFVAPRLARKTIPEAMAAEGFAMSASLMASVGSLYIPPKVIGSGGRLWNPHVEVQPNEDNGEVSLTFDPRDAQPYEPLYDHNELQQRLRRDFRQRYSLPFTGLTYPLLVEQQTAGVEVDTSKHGLLRLKEELGPLLNCSACPPPSWLTTNGKSLHNLILRRQPPLGRLLGITTGCARPWVHACPDKKQIMRSKNLVLEHHLFSSLERRSSKLPTWRRQSEAHVLGYASDPQYLKLDQYFSSQPQVDKSIVVNRVKEGLRRLGARPVLMRLVPPELVSNVTAHSEDFPLNELVESIAP